ncbi:hypothetical protein [Phascolarctobacterium faecium]|uniref:hypothetical protein n=1 Tax=Phascolarctobacterium faecium TaxID=33025 RepID=UPI003520F66B
MLKVKKEIRREYFEGKTMSWEVVKEMEDKANETGELLCVVIGNSIVINSSYYPACDSACSLNGYGAWFVRLSPSEMLTECYSLPLPILMKVSWIGLLLRWLWLVCSFKLMTSM